MQKCNKCGFMHYISDGCRKPKESAAARKDVPQAAIAKRGLTDVSLNAVVGREGETTPAAGTQALPVDTIQKPKHKDRHKPGYMKEYLRRWRRGEVGNKYKKDADK